MTLAAASAGAQTPGLTLDKTAGTVTLQATVAPRKLDKVTHPDLKPGDPRRSTVYPLEVFACHAFPAQKAHETVLLLTAKPSDLHAALEALGLKPGKPGLRGGQKATGPALSLTLEWTTQGQTMRVPAESVIVDATGQKPLPKLRWLFTGSAMINPDPETDAVAYGADFTKTLVGIYPITDQTVIQTDLDEETVGLKLETNKSVLPPEGTPLKLIIAPAK